MSWKSCLAEDNKYVADLNLVPQDKKKDMENNELGVEGSFRKLDLD